MDKIFLGGTCNDTTWRQSLINYLPKSIEYFNPVVNDWTPDCIEIENEEKQNRCNIHLYVITKEMSGVYSIAEIIQSSVTNDITTMVCILKEGFEESMSRSLNAVTSMAESNGAIILTSDTMEKLAIEITNLLHNENN